MSFSTLIVALLFAFTDSAFGRTCKSYGVDYSEGKSYYLPGKSTAAFQSIQQFSGCTHDLAYNVLVDPSGQESECSQTPMQPAYTDQTFTCDGWTYDKMYTGDWSIIVTSNNGNEEPIVYQRDFYISITRDSAPTATPTSNPLSLLDSTSLIQTTWLPDMTSILDSTALIDTTSLPDSTSVLASSLPPQTPAEFKTVTFNVFHRNAYPSTFTRAFKNATTPTFVHTPVPSPEPTSTVEITTTVDITVTSHVTLTTTVYPSVTSAVHVPIGPGGKKPALGWNSTISIYSLLTGTAPVILSTGVPVPVAPTAGLPEDHPGALMPTAVPKPISDLAHMKLIKTDTSKSKYSGDYWKALKLGEIAGPDTRAKFVEERRKKLHG